MFKKNIVFVFIFFFFCGPLKADGPEQVREIDLGRISGEEIVTREIVLDQRVETAVALCECLSFKISESGEKSVLSISFDPAGYSGETRQELIALSNDIKIRIVLRAQVD